MSWDIPDGLAPFPETPRAAFSLHTGNLDVTQLPAECPNITEFTFDPSETPELEYPIRVTLGYTSSEAKAAVYSDMARRMAGERTLCGVSSIPEDIPPEADDTEGEFSSATGRSSLLLGFALAAVAFLV